MRFKAGIIQMNILLGQVEANLYQAIDAIEMLLKKETKLIVLPELWITGFAYPYIKYLAKKTPEILKMLQQAIKEEVTIIGSFPEIKAEKLYNSAFVITKKKILATYAKVHLFTPTGEQKYFTPGDKATVVATPVGKIGLLICYDLRFPEFARCLTLKGAEILAISAAWPLARIEHFRLLLRTRAIENQVFVIAANATGTQGKITMGGYSAIISPFGEPLVEAEEDPTFLQADIDLNMVHTFRQEIPCLKNRRPEVYHEQG